MNWLNTLLKGMALVPYVVMGIQQLHAAAKGTDKKTLALESLGLATAVSQEILPPEQATQAAAISTILGNSIDQWVAAFHSTNAPGFGTNSTTPTA